MNVLIIVETCFGTTAAIADAVAAGLREKGANVEIASAAVAPDFAGRDLVVVGAPTHNLGLPTPASRAKAREQGGSPAESGVAEWLDALPRDAIARTAAFDTAVGSFFGGSAAKRIEKALKRAGASVIARESFVVAGTPAQLADGEGERARAWGASLL